MSLINRHDPLVGDGLAKQITTPIFQGRDAVADQLFTIISFHGKPKATAVLAGCDAVGLPFNENRLTEAK